MADDENEIKDLAKALNEGLSGATRLSSALRTLGTNLGVSGQDALSFTKALSFLPGPLKGVAEGLFGSIKGFGELSASVGPANAAMAVAAGGVVSLAAAVAQLAVEVAVGAVKFGIWAVGLADSARSAGLTREAFEVLNPGLKGLGATFDELHKTTRLGDGALMGFAKQLEAAGLSGETLKKGLKAVALAEAGVGQGAGAELIEDLAQAGENAGGLADVMSFQLGDKVKAKMLGVDQQSEKLKENIGGLFGGLKIEPLLKGMEMLVGLFDQNSESGKAIKALFENLFQPLIDMAPKLAEIFAKFFGGFIKGASALLGPLSSAFAAVSKLFGLKGDSLEAVLFIAEGVGKKIGFIFGVVATVFGVVIANVLAFIGFFLAIPAAIVALDAAITQFVSMIFGLDFGKLATDAFNGIVRAAEFVGTAIVEAFTSMFNTVVEFISSFDFLTIAFEKFMGIVAAVQQVGAMLFEAFMSTFNSVVEFILSLDFVQMGIDIMMGLASGITNSAGAVLNAISGAVQGAINSAVSLLKIGSPSKVFEDIGVNTGEGFAGGVEAENDNAQAAITALVEPPTGLASVGSELAAAASPVDSGAAVGSAPGGAGPNFAGATFNFFGVKDAEHSQELFREMLVRVMSGEAASLGSAASPTDAEAA